MKTPQLLPNLISKFDRQISTMGIYFKTEEPKIYGL